MSKSTSSTGSRRGIRYPSFLLAQLAYRAPMPIRELRLFANGDSYYSCPRCNETLDREYLPYCYCCGQRLHWRHCQLAKVILIDV